MINYPTFDIPTFLDIRLIVILIGITAVVSFAVLYFVYAHNTKTIISPTTGKKWIKRPSDALPATSLTISIIGIFAVVALYFFAPLYNDWLMSTKIEKDYNVNVLAMTKTHNVTATADGSLYPCSISSGDQKKYSLICEIPGGRMSLDWIMKNKAK
jgi:heme/copper-type cytochrome/quinol oxidase subunit 2